MAGNVVSEQEAKLFLLLRENPSEWLTAKRLATSAEISERTARMHLLRYVRSGIVQVRTVFPGYRYQISDQARKRDPGRISRLESAIDVIGFVRSIET